jgi:O-methyltransferase involved in polyketide biosynthesis
MASPFRHVETAHPYLRLRHLGLCVFEIDHPATQAKKRRLAGDAATFVVWDFERDPLERLPERLRRDLGYRARNAAASSGKARRGCRS